MKGSGSYIGVLDGQAVNAAVTNPAFINKNINDSMPNILGLTNTFSPSIADIQAAANKLYTATGASESATGTNYNATSGTITNGQNYQTALGILANKFSALTGHMHTGTAGDGPLLNVVRSIAVTGGSPQTGGIVLIGSGSLTITPATGGVFIFNDSASGAGVSSIAVSGSTALTGAVILQPGSGVTLTQSGQNISIAASGSVFLTPNVQEIKTTGTYNPSYYFSVSSANATAAATYTNNGATFTVITTIASGTLLLMTGTGVPSSSGTLTKSTGTGDSSITFSSYRPTVYQKVTVVGGGGGGGGGGNTTSGGGGGGGGEAAADMISSTTVGNSQTVTIGAGGSGGNSGTSSTNGTSGGTTTFGSLLTAAGGSFGTQQDGATQGGQGGAGGVTVSPTNGKYRASGQGGGAGGPGVAGASQGAGGMGGSSGLGLGGGGASAIFGNSGVSGGAFGGGGGGGPSANAIGSLTAGPGAAGVCIVEDHFQ